jgi:Ca2+-transporting ATPase
MSAWHEQTIEQIKTKLNVDTDKGLSSTELAEREATYGKNKLKEGKKHGWLYKFFMQMKDLMIIVLLAAAAVSVIIAIVENQPEDLVEAGIILAIVLINAIIGVVQESKAENALEALKGMNKSYAKVIRDGEVVKIPAEDLYPGDIVLLEAGDFVPADIRLIESASLKIEEAALTGESLPVQKNTDVIPEGKTPLGDRKNMAYSSGSVAYGRGKGIVVATGMETEVGKIAGMLEEPETDTPLQ